MFHRMSIYHNWLPDKLNTKKVKSLKNGFETVLIFQKTLNICIFSHPLGYSICLTSKKLLTNKVYTSL